MSMGAPPERMTDAGQSTTTVTAEAEAAKDQMLAGQVITACNAALNVFKIHAADNKAVEQPLRALTSGLEALSHRHSRVTLACVEGIFYLGDSRIRMSGSQQQIADQLAAVLDGLAVGGFTFEGVPASAELIDFFKVLNEVGKEEKPENADLVREALRDAGVASVIVSRVLKPITEDERVKSDMDRGADVYSAAIRHVATLFGRKGGVSGGAARSKRIVHDLVDLATSDGCVHLSLAGLRGTGSESGEHAVAVSVLSIALGKRLGLSKVVLADLGLAALHHDVGLTLLAADQQNDMAKHPVLSLKSLLGSERLDERILRQVIVGFEHHLDFAGGGLPILRGQKSSLHPLAQIVRIANDFDGLTRGKGGRPMLDVMDALAEMGKGRREHYHPDLFQMFYDMVGGVEDPTAPVEYEDVVVEPDPARGGLDAVVEPQPAPGGLDNLLADFLEPESPKGPEPAGVDFHRPKPKVVKKKKKGVALGMLKLKRVVRKRKKKSA